MRIVFTNRTWKGRLRRVLVVAPGVLLASAVVVLTPYCLLRDARQRAQTQSDPRVATVWVAGVTRGANQTLVRGTPLQKWLNGFSISCFGEYKTLQSRFGGEPGSLEIWFDYDSHLPHRAELECHRVGETAFVDDLGQPYHGFLDFQGRYVGVYLPGYDRAARKLVCAVRWMPRQPALPTPTSEPMLFTLDLPPARRVLPLADALPHGPLTAARQGVIVTVGEARLGAPKLGRSRSQRELTFRLNIGGGEIAGPNVNTALLALLDARADRTGVPARSARIGRRPEKSERPFQITDPYGISLLSDLDEVMPMRTLDLKRCLRNADGTIWVAPVNSAGRGTDAVRLRFDVRPTDRPFLLVPFDLTIPVQTDDTV